MAEKGRREMARSVTPAIQGVMTRPFMWRTCTIMHFLQGPAANFVRMPCRCSAPG